MILSAFGDKCPQNGSQNGETAPRPETGYHHEGPSVGKTGPFKAGVIKANNSGSVDFRTLVDGIAKVRNGSNVQDKSEMPVKLAPPYMYLSLHFYTRFPGLKAFHGEIYLRIQVCLVIYDSGHSSLQHLLPLGYTSKKSKTGTPPKNQRRGTPPKYQKNQTPESFPQGKPGGNEGCTRG